MLIISFRTVLIFVFLTIFMRLLGKRQVGQLEIGEFVSALLISELAASPIADPDAPLLFALLPMALIVILEILISCLCAHFPSVKKLFDGCPSVLIRKGQVDQDALAKARLSPDELLSQLRLKGCAHPAEADYAVLEQNGQLSVIFKASDRPLTPGDLQLNLPDEGYALPLVICGRINHSALCASGMGEKDLIKKLKGTPLSSVLLFAVDDTGKEFLAKYKNNKEKP